MKEEQREMDARKKGRAVGDGGEVGANGRKRTAAWKSREISRGQSV